MDTIQKQYEDWEMPFLMFVLVMSTSLGKTDNRK